MHTSTIITALAGLDQLNTATTTSRLKVAVVTGAAIAALEHANTSRPATDALNLTVARFDCTDTRNLPCTGVLFLVMDDRGEIRSTTLLNPGAPRHITVSHVLDELLTDEPSVSADLDEMPDQLHTTWIDTDLTVHDVCHAAVLAGYLCVNRGWAPPVLTAGSEHKPVTMNWSPDARHYLDVDLIHSVSNQSTGYRVSCGNTETDAFIEKETDELQQLPELLNTALTIL